MTVNELYIKSPSFINNRYLFLCGKTAFLSNISLYICNATIAITHTKVIAYEDKNFFRNTTIESAGQHV